MKWLPVTVTLAIGLLSPPPVRAQAAPPGPVRIGVVAGPMGSFAATILGSLQIGFQKISDKLPGDSLAAFDLLVVDNLFRLQDLNGPAFKSYVENGGVLLVINPKTDGFSRTWSPYDVFIGEPTREGRITEREHPIFAGFTDDKLVGFAESNGPFVGNCSFTEPAVEWKVLARHKDKKKNALILEAEFGRGRVILTCTRFDHYNARAAVTRLGDNLFRYAIRASEGIGGR